MFDLHPAKRLLGDDLRNQRHIGLTPKAFRLTRAENQDFDLEVFRQRIYQEIRREKFINWLNERRDRGTYEINSSDFICCATDTLGTLIFKKEVYILSFKRYPISVFH